MTELPSPAGCWDIDRLTAERTEAVSAFGFTDRQARFLVEVLIHSGVTNPLPMDFRMFLIRHSELLRPLNGWTIRVLVPEPFVKAIRVFGHAARETLATAIAPSAAEALRSHFHDRTRRHEQQLAPPDDDFRSAASAHRAPRFQALLRVWQQEGDPII